MTPKEKADQAITKVFQALDIKLLKAGFYEDNVPASKEWSLSGSGDSDHFDSLASFEGAVRGALEALQLRKLIKAQKDEPKKGRVKKRDRVWADEGEFHFHYRFDRKKIEELFNPHAKVGHA